MARTIVGLFENFQEAHDAVEALEKLGFSRDDIGIATHRAGEDESSDETAIIPETANGAALGGLGGLLVGLGFLAVPGMGALMAAGPLLAALTGAGIGAAGGGLIGALTHAHLPEEEAREYAAGVRRGGTLVAVNVPEDRIRQVQDLFRTHHAIEIPRPDGTESEDL